MSKIRLDEWLVQKGHYPSRARARDAILRGCISLQGDLTPKPSRTVPSDDAVTIDDPALRYVSRAALKLVHALDVTRYSPEGKIALDIGASTGGFCQVLLEAGADKVFALDVGHDQIDIQVLSDKRISNLEKLNARDLTLEHLEGIQPDFLTSDVSFISLKLALPPALELAANGAIGIFLIKPQFEVGKDALGKGGVVREDGLAQATAEELKSWLDTQAGWSVTHCFPSPVTGGDGNTEFLMAAIKDG